MPNELVTQRPAQQEPPSIDYGRDLDGEEWDLPPEAMGYGPRPPAAGPVHTPRTIAAAQRAAQDASQARQEGDPEFASARESDASELTQTRWDWGDVPTWLWFAAMFFGFLLLVALCYFLPEGRHASPPPIRVY
jgi:hypothetical protein